MSAPNSPGGVSLVRASKSVATTNLHFLLTLMRAASALMSSIRPSVAAAHQSSHAHSTATDLGTAPWLHRAQFLHRSRNRDGRPPQPEGGLFILGYTCARLTSIPSGSARCLITAMVCGWQLSETKNFLSCRAQRVSGTQGAVRGTLGEIDMHMAIASAPAVPCVYATVTGRHSLQLMHLV